MSPRRLALIAVIVTVVIVIFAAKAFAAPALTAQGWGRLRIGMRERDAVRLFHLRIGRDDTDSYECRQDTWPRHPHVWIMARNGRVSRISTDQRSLVTDKGIGVGSSERDIARSYGPTLVIGPHAYDDPPAHYVTVWTIKGQRGVRFETDPHGIVRAVHVGDDAIEYVEGCL